MKTDNPIDLDKAVKKKCLSFRNKLMKWAGDNLREYPWRTAAKSPYEILVAEILLKRTTASAAAKVYDSFLRTYPTLLDLADASEQDLIRHLAHVGLYRQRARDIAKLAQYLVQKENGIIPCLLEELLNVPGLGEYSARAILSFGCTVPAAVVDANVERVINRVFFEAIPSKPTYSTFQRIADELLCKENHRQFNFGLLDLGAVVCRYSVPRHNNCPLAEICDFYRQSQEELLPTMPVHSLRRIRQEKGFTLAELAKRAVVSKLTIIRIEAARTAPQPITIEKLANALGVKPDDLVAH